MIHSFLLIGQSNMAGRGAFDEAPIIENQKLKVLRNGRWQNMFLPINPDRDFAGRSLAEKFADEYSKAHPDADVGLIPCADGGTSLAQWAEGGLLYDHAIAMAKLAQRTSTIAGILWHQGEADCHPSLHPLYEEKFTKILNAFRRDLDLYDVPFLIGGLGDFLPYCIYNDPSLKNYHYVNTALKKIAAEHPMTGFVSAEGLTANSDNLHFNTKSLMEFGKRYFEAFEKLEDKNKAFQNKPSVNDAIRTEMEKF